MFQIEPSVPVPAGRSKRYPCAKMEVGHSFLIKGEAGAKRARNAAYIFANKANAELKAQGVSEDALVRFSTKHIDTVSEDGNEVKVYRLWRV